MHGGGDRTGNTYVSIRLAGGPLDRRERHLKLRHSVGIQIQLRGGRAYICNGNLGVEKPNALADWDLRRRPSPGELNLH